MKIIVIGLGVIGLPTAYMLASKGCQVIAIDNDVERVQNLCDKNKKLPFEDIENIRKIAEKNIEIIIGYPGRLKSVIESNKGDIEAIIVCIGVDVDERKNPIMEPLNKVVEEISSNILLCKKGLLISIETTIPVGTTIEIAERIENHEPNDGLECGKDFYVIHAPERVTIKKLIHNIKNMPRIVGGVTDQCAGKGSGLYSKICDDVRLTNSRTAEMTKLSENTYRDVNIALANELQMLCDEKGIDFQEVRKLVNSLPSIPGDEYTNPVRNLHQSGVGVGGYCLPKDPWLLLSGFELKNNCGVIRNSRNLNEYMSEYIVSKVMCYVKPFMVVGKGKIKALVLGYSGVRDTGDDRKTPVEYIVKRLRDKSIDVEIYDPYIKKYTTGLSGFGNIKIDLYDVVILGCPHSIFNEVVPEWLMKKLISQKVAIV